MTARSFYDTATISLAELGFEREYHVRIKYYPNEGEPLLSSIALQAVEYDSARRPKAPDMNAWEDAPEFMLRLLFGPDESETILWRLNEYERGEYGREREQARSRKDAA